MTNKPDAFLSYTRFDNRRGRIVEFCEELSYAVEAVSGESFTIFQDVEGIGIGEHWPDKLDDMLKQARFFIPIITPKFFNSAPCRDELTKFLKQEQKIGRKDLVLPIYWIPCPKLEEGHLKAADDLAREIDERQRWDWRALLFEDLTSAVCRRELHALSTQIERVRRNVLRVVETPKMAVGGEASLGSTVAVRAVPTPKPKRASSSPAATGWTAGDVFRDIDEPWYPEMVRIPAGTFLMGSPETEEGRRDDEGPQHKVTISRDFTLGRFPVTFEEYDRFCVKTKREKPKDHGWGRGRRPVIDVNHGEAEAYCAWLSEITGAHYRLPTEAEWEYACRASSTDAYAYGHSISKAQANFSGTVGKTTEVGTYPANLWGLYDLHGNVWEWCSDARRTYKPEPVTDPEGEGTGTGRVLRGGSWVSNARYLRSARRDAAQPVSRDGRFGFRCARVQEPAGSR